MAFNYKQPEMYSPSRESPFLRTSTPMAIKNILPLAGSLVSGLFGQIGQNRIINQQSAANNAAFQQNKQLAQLQNQLNIEQWQRANNYDLPINQIKRLKEAGLSPNLMYSNGTSGLTASTSPSMSGGTPTSPQDMSLGGRRQTIGDAIQNTLNNSMQSAQIELLKAQANKTKSETRGINISNDVNEQLLLAKTDAEVKQILSGTNLNNKQIEQISANIEKFKKESEVFDVTIQEKLANIDNMTFGQFRSMLDYEMQRNLNDANIKKIEAETSLTKQQIKQIAHTLPFVLSKYAAEIKSINANTETAEVNKLLVTQQIASEITKRINIKANTDYVKAQTETINATNVKLKDQAERYQNLYGFEKDFIFTHDMGILNDVLVALGLLLK